MKLTEEDIKELYKVAEDYLPIWVWPHRPSARDKEILKAVFYAIKRHAVHQHTPICNPFNDEPNHNPGKCLEGFPYSFLQESIDSAKRVTKNVPAWELEQRVRRPHHKCPGPNCNIHDVKNWINDGVYNKTKDDL